MLIKIFSRALYFIFYILLFVFCGDSFAKNSWSGVYEQIMIARRSDGSIIGTYLEKQDNRSCAFFLAGNADGGIVRLVTWSDDFYPPSLQDGSIFPGVLKRVEKGIALTVPNGSKHPGCGLVLMPEVATIGVEFEKIFSADWIDLRRIDVERSYFYSASDSSTRRKAYVVRNDIVGVLSRQGDWLEVEYPGDHGRVKGWIPVTDAAELHPPAVGK